MLKNNTRFLIQLLEYEGRMRWQILEPETREMLAHAQTWDHAVMVAQELEKQVLLPITRRLTQQDIDARGEHRKEFDFTLTQLRTAIGGSLKRAW